MLWVFDPKAMHHIVVKDQDIYEEAPSQITFVIAQSLLWCFMSNVPGSQRTQIGHWSEPVCNPRFDERLCGTDADLTMIFLGEHHRKQRKLLNPVFSIAHMRRLTPIFSEVVNRVCLRHLPLLSLHEHHWIAPHRHPDTAQNVFD